MAEPAFHLTVKIMLFANDVTRWHEHALDTHPGRQSDKLFGNKGFPLLAVEMS